MILIGAPLNDVLRSVALLIEAHTEGAVCSIFLLDEDGQHLRYAAAPKLSDEYRVATDGVSQRSEEHTSELQSPDHLVCRLLLEKKKKNIRHSNVARVTTDVI